MRYSISFLPEVENDIISAYLWYEEKSKGLGEEFLRIFYASSAEIVRTPNFYRKVYKDFRRFLFKRFPYAIYFFVKKKAIIVYGVFHCARNPYFIQEKIKNRYS